MSLRRPFRPVVLGIALALAPCAIGVKGAWAGKNDLNLLNLCPQTSALSSGARECAWVTRNALGQVTGVNVDTLGRSNFRSLMSELGVVMGPRIPMPADTLGFAGFLVSAELGFTEINRNKDYWNGVNAVSPQNPSSSRPDATLTTMGVFLRKGLWWPLPAIEFGGGVVSLLNSQMLSWQGYTKIALLEGFHDWPMPSVAVRAAVAYLTGTDQVSLRTTTLDVLVSKGFGLLKTARLEPFGGWSLVMIRAQSKMIDFTPLCDSQLEADAAPGEATSDHCSASQNGTKNDLNANAAFPAQDTIIRYRLFAGAKLKFGILALIAQYELYLAGHTRDESVVPAVDQSGQQRALSLSAGLTF